MAVFGMDITVSTVPPEPKPIAHTGQPKLPAIGAEINVRQENCAPPVGPHWQSGNARSPRKLGWTS